MLRWDAVAGAVRYELWTWWDDTTGWQRLDDGNLTETEYTHGGVTAGRTYFYAIRAIDASGVASGWSAYAYATAAADMTTADGDGGTGRAGGEGGAGRALRGNGRRELEARRQAG